jgi:hypothetical protein
VTPAEHVRKLIEKWLDPDNVNAHYFLLPRDAVEATRTPLLPRNPPTATSGFNYRKLIAALFVLSIFGSHRAAYWASVRMSPREGVQSTPLGKRWWLGCAGLQCGRPSP